MMLLNLWLPAKDQALKISAWKDMDPWDTTSRFQCGRAWTPGTQPHWGSYWT